MVDLFEELSDVNQVTEDHFIFLNNKGEVQLKQKIYFTWVDFPNKQILIICSPDDSLSYIKALLCFSLEKYPIFSGINSVKISELYSSKETLKEVKNMQKGTIGEYLKPDEKFSFKVVSSEIWLEVQIDLRDLLSAVFFQVKVSIGTSILALRKLCMDIMNSVLKFQNIEGQYKEESILIQQLILNDEEFLGHDLKGMILNKYTKVKCVNKIDVENCVKDYFNIRDHFLLCVPPGKKLGNSKTKKSALRDLFSPAFLHVLHNEDLGFIVKNAKFEAKGIGVRRQVSGQVQKKIVIDEPKSQACSCLLF